MTGPIPLTLDVSRELGSSAALTTSAWVFAPRGPTAGAPVVLFAFPGGGYSKAYFHMEVPAHPGYSMAEYLAGRGFYVVACDNLAAGQSSRPQPASALSWTAMVDANQATVAGALKSLRSPGSLPGIAPLGECTVIGLGHSLGAGLVTAQQARHGTFDALVILGRAIAGTHIPAPPEGAETEPVWKPVDLQRDEFAATSELRDGYHYQWRRTAWQRYLYYWDDVPAAVIAADEAAGTTFAVEVARAFGARGGPGAQAAAAVEVPLLLGFGERDVVQDPRAEVGAYRSATDIQLTIVRRSAHSHNLAGSRYWLWDRIARWSDSLAPR